MYRLEEIRAAAEGFHYLASPYSLNGSASEEVMARNYGYAVDATARLMGMGIVVFSPIANWHDAGSVMKKKSPQWWLTRCAVFLRDAESLWVLTTEGWDVSAGVQWEIEYAKSHNIPITYFKVDDQ